MLENKKVLADCRIFPSNAGKKLSKRENVFFIKNVLWTDAKNCFLDPTVKVIVILKNITVMTFMIFCLTKIIKHN